MQCQEQDFGTLFQCFEAPVREKSTGDGTIKVRLVNHAYWIRDLPFSFLRFAIHNLSEILQCLFGIILLLSCQGNTVRSEMNSIPIESASLTFGQIVLIFDIVLAIIHCIVRISIVFVLEIIVIIIPCILYYKFCLVFNVYACRRRVCGWTYIHHEIIIVGHF
jgi:hypothetical protein